MHNNNVANIEYSNDTAYLQTDTAYIVMIQTDKCIWNKTWEESIKTNKSSTSNISATTTKLKLFKMIWNNRKLWAV